MESFGINHDSSTIDWFDPISLLGGIRESQTTFFFGVGSVDNQKDFSLRGNLMPKSLTYKVVTTVRGFLPF